MPAETERAEDYAFPLKGCSVPRKTEPCKKEKGGRVEFGIINDKPDPQLPSNGKAPHLCQHMPSKELALYIKIGSS